MFDNLQYVFDAEARKNIPQDTIDGVRHMYSLFIKNKSLDSSIQSQMVYYQAYLVLYNYLKSKEEEPGKVIDRDRDDIFKEVKAYYQVQYNKYHKQYISREKLRLEVKLEEEIGAEFGTEYSYELSDTDIEEIQRLSLRIREIIYESEEFYDEHRQRILKLLGKFDSELYSKMTHYGNFMAMMWEMNAVYKNVKEASPLLSTLFEIGKIIKNSCLFRIPTNSC